MEGDLEGLKHMEADCCPMFCEISSPTEKHMNRLYHGVFRSSWLIMFDSLMQEFERQSFSHPLFNRESAGDVNHTSSGADRFNKDLQIYGFNKLSMKATPFLKDEVPEWTE